MAILDKDRKRLWAKSGNCCAICKQKLIMSNANGLDYNIGEECHIVSSKVSGPRYETGLVNYDVYENLILLCRNHHKTIDDVSNLSKYSKQCLLDIKSKHESWVEERLSDNKKGYCVHLIQNGAELVSIISGVCEMGHTNDSITNKVDAEFIGSIWQTLGNYADIYHDLEPYQQTLVEFELQELLTEMAQKGFFYLWNSCC